MIQPGTAGIDVPPYPAAGAGHSVVRLEQDVPATGSRDVCTGRRDVGAAVPLLRLMMLQVDVDHDEPVPGRHTDQRIGAACPPVAECGGIVARILEPVVGQRALARGAREDRHPRGETQCVMQCGHERGVPQNRIWSFMASAIGLVLSGAGGSFGLTASDMNFVPFFEVLIHPESQNSRPSMSIVPR